MAAAKTKLTKLEDLLKEGGFTLRYERGHFRAGYCVVHERRVVVVNKFFDKPARAQKIQEFVVTLDIDRDNLSEVSAALYDAILAKQAALVDQPEATT